jgi:hypothetical protein
MPCTVETRDQYFVDLNCIKISVHHEITVLLVVRVRDHFSGLAKWSLSNNAEQTSLESMKTVSPPPVKRKRSDDEEPARRVAQRIEPAEKLSEEEPMVKIVLEDLWSKDERTLEEAMEWLAKSLRDKDDARLAEKQKAFIQIGGHLAVSRAMKEHIDNELVQLCGVLVLGNATYMNSSSQSPVAKVEGIHATIAAMEKFPQERFVIYAGFLALCSITCGHETNADLLVKKIHAIPFLVERMAEFKHDEDVMLSACGMLNYACRFHQLREMIVDAKGISALASALESHRDNHDIQEIARAAMKLLM